VVAEGQGLLVVLGEGWAGLTMSGGRSVEVVDEFDGTKKRGGSRRLPVREEHRYYTIGSDRGLKPEWRLTHGWDSSSWQSEPSVHYD